MGSNYGHGTYITADRDHGAGVLDRRVWCRRESDRFIQRITQTIRAREDAEIAGSSQGNGFVQAGRSGRNRQGMVSKKKRDPRTDPSATLGDFVYRINRMGFSNAQRAEFPLWTVTDVRWAAVEVEKLLTELKALGWHRQELDPLERVLSARWAVYRMAHALRLRTNNIEARRIASAYRHKPY